MFSKSSHWCIIWSGDVQGDIVLTQNNVKVGIIETNMSFEKYEELFWKFLIIGKYDAEC